MRPWKAALASIVPADQVVLMYKPARWAEYGLQYYWFNRIQTAFSPDELARATSGGTRMLCIAEDSTLLELSHMPALDLQVIHAIGGQTAFWIWKVK
jgi:hypothetical protein